jgi:hypothetical protein
MMHELDQIAQRFEAELKKVDYDLELALNRVDMLRKMRENLSRMHIKAQVEYLHRAKAEIYKKDKNENVL